MKAWTIAIKDTLIRFRDRNAILLMIAAPLAIALIMGLAFGDQSSGNSPLSEIPLLVLNADEGDLGERFASILGEIEVPTSEGQKNLFEISLPTDKSTGLAKIEQGEARGFVYIPPDFSHLLRQKAEADHRETALIEVYTDPAADISPNIIRGVVNRVASGFSTITIGNRVAVDQLLDTVTGIPVGVVNDDYGPVGEVFVKAFSTENTGGVVTPSTLDDLAAARVKLNVGDLEAIVHITPGFSQAVMHDTGSEQVAENIEVISAAGSLSAPIVEDLAHSIALRFGGDQKARPEGLLARLSSLETILADENASFAETDGPRQRIDIVTVTGGDSKEFDLLGYFVPSMAIFFLMFAAFDGTRSILEEERDGTLHRLMTTPTPVPQILLGKIGGTFLTGILQFIVLVLASALLFRVGWGNSPLGTALMVLGTVAAATSLGAFLASFARNANQAGVLGTAVNLIFAILGGNFITVDALPSWLDFISKLTINRWSLDGFTDLNFRGLGAIDVLPNVGILLGISAVFFILASLLFRRRFVR